MTPDPTRGDVDAAEQREESSLVEVGPAGRFLEDGDRVVTKAGGHEILTLACDGEIFAVGNRCTHRPWWLDAGRVLPVTCEIECALHEGRFSLRTGAVTDGPPRKPIRTYDVEVIDGVVHVRVPILTNPES
ncbi:Rieske 2Fe-2S domain-containing protein [Streptomyces sp. NPDC002809]|uniref:Rieske (2Fe-2S) protein n=1 Tax=Streptomyces sp. NPDC002809 TaxID=3154433 RepID=UPI00331E5A6C